MAEKPGITGIGGHHTAQAVVETIALGTANEVAVWANNTGATVRITEVGVVPDTAVTGATTNNFILQARNKGTDGTGTTAVTAAKTYGTGVDMTAFNQDDLVLSTTLANLDIADGETLALNKTETGSGLALPAGIVVIKYRFER